MAQDFGVIGQGLADAGGDLSGGFQNGIIAGGQGTIKSLAAKSGQVTNPDPNALKNIDPNEYKYRALQGQSASTFDPAQMQSVGINTNPQDQFRQQQLALANQLAAQAAGKNSITAQQAAQSQSAALAASQAQLASSRGPANPALARAALQQNAQTQQQIAQQAQVNRLQEQMQAAGMLGNIAGQGRSSDIGLAQNQAELQQQANSQNAQLQQQAAIANQTSQQNFQGLQQKYMAMGLNADQANQQAALEFERLRTGQVNTQTANELAAQTMDRQAVGSLLSGSGSAVTSVLSSKNNGSAAAGEV